MNICSWRLCEPSSLLFVFSLMLSVAVLVLWRPSFNLISSPGARGHPKLVSHVSDWAWPITTAPILRTQPKAALQQFLRNHDLNEVNGPFVLQYNGSYFLAPINSKKTTGTKRERIHLDGLAKRNQQIHLDGLAKSKQQIHLDGLAKHKQQIHLDGLVKRKQYWKYLEQKIASPVRIDWSANDPVMTPAFIHWSVEPTWTCTTMQRYGVLGEGGKMICDETRILGGGRGGDGDGERNGQPPLVYSFGSRLECDFEKDLKQRFPNTDIHVFDPTPGVVEGFASSECRNFVKFHDIGLGGINKSIFLDGIYGAARRKVPLSDLLEVQSSLGHANRVLDILKVDIEGSEFDAFSYLAKNAKSKNWLGAKLIMVEVHLFSQQFRSSWTPALTMFKKFFSDLQDMGYRVYYKEINPYDARKCVEYAMINEKYLS